MVYLVPSCALYAISLRFNPPFLVYVALLACSLYGLIGGLLMVDMAGIKVRFAKTAFTRADSVCLAVLPILFYSLWLSETVPALVAGSTPQDVIDDGAPTNAAQVLDMACILPAFVVAAVNLRRKRPLGYTLAGAMPSYFVLLISAMLSIVFRAQAGHPVVVSQVAIFGILLAIALATLVWLLKDPESRCSNQAVSSKAQ